MNTELKNAVAASDKAAQYDECAKRLLSQKNILAHILVKTVDEFMGMNPNDVVPCIIGTPYISKVPTEPGLTNAASQSKHEKKTETKRVVGFNTEDNEINEGLIRFDIIFRVQMRDGISHMIVNIEAQKSEPTEYEILNRAVFYVSRLISSQKERDFTNSNFDDIQRVYSIWVCMGMKENVMSHIHFTKEDIIGSYDWKGKLDLANIVMLGLLDVFPEHDTTYELHRLLGTLLSKNLTINEKLTIIEKEYEIPLDETFREDVNVMCNLSQGIKEDGIAIGRAEGKAEIILDMYRNGLGIELIAKYIGKNIEDVKAIIEKAESVLI